MIPHTAGRDLDVTTACLRNLPVVAIVQNTVRTGCRVQDGQRDIHRLVLSNCTGIIIDLPVLRMGVGCKHWYKRTDSGRRRAWFTGDVLAVGGMFAESEENRFHLRMSSTD